MAIANVTLNNTFDEWRSVTNQIVTFVNEVETQQLINAVSNTTALTVTPRNIPRNGTLYITLNVSNSFLDTSTMNVATAFAVNSVTNILSVTNARLVQVSDNANVINAIANAAFIQANTTRVHANTAHASANAGMAIGNAAFTQANTSRDHANTAHASANAGLLQANTSRDHANTAHASANAAQLQANTARDHANTAHASANAGMAIGNAAFTQANTARNHANAAFLAANTNSVANTLANGMSQIRATRGILNFVPTGTIVTFIEDDSVGNRINISSQVIGIGSIGDTANLGFVHANAAFAQANTARVHANTAHASANAAFDQANTARVHANTSHASANAGQATANASYAFSNSAHAIANLAFVHANNSFDKANAAYTLANSVSGGQAPILEANKAAFDTANAAFDQANTARVHANTAHASANAGLLQANTSRVHANQAFEKANAALPNTSGVSFVGNLQIPTGNLTIGSGITQGIRVYISDHTPVSNVYPQIKALSGSQFIQFNANTNVGGWNDLMFDRDISIIYSKGLADDSANLVIAPWSDSSFGYKQDGAGRHGFNTSNPRHVLDANGSANISGSLLVGAMNVVPTVTAAMVHANAAFAAANTGTGLGSAFSQANTARDHANTSHASANAGQLQANTARDHANVGFLQANTARVHANVAFEQANTARVHANAAFSTANAAIANTAGITTAGTLFVPTALYVRGQNTVHGIIDFSNTVIITPNTGTWGTSIRLNSMLATGAPDSVAIWANGTARIIITDYGHISLGAGSTPTANLHVVGNTTITSAAVVAGMNVVPTVQSAFGQANTARDQANTSFLQANASRSIIQTDALSATRYIVFTDKTTGLLANANVATSLSYNPSSGALVATSLKSSALYDSSDRQLLIKDSTGTVVWGN